MPHDAASMVVAEMGAITMPRKKDRTLADLRNAAGLTQMDVAQELGCHVRLYAGWEGGDSQPSARYALRLVDVLGVSAADLLTALENVANR